MLQLYNHLRDRQPIRLPSKLSYVRKYIKENTEYYIKYWQRMNWTVRNDHILVGLITELSTIATNPLDIYDSIKITMNNKVLSRGIASSISYGRVQPKSFFYGSGCREIITEQSFDDSIEQIFNRHYTQWEPVRVIYHPFTSFDYQLANGKQRVSGEQGICIIKVDLALLYTQYKMWRQDKIRSTYEDGTVKNIANFVHSYPVVNMLKSHIEQVWFNRLVNKTLGLPISNNKPDSRTRHLDIYPDTDETLDKLIEYFSKIKIEFHDILSSIPGIYSKNMKSFLLQDNILITHQIKLPWILANLPFISWLIQLEFQYGNGGNKSFIHDIIRSHKSYLGGYTYGTIRGLDSKEVTQYVEDNIISIINLL